MHMYSRVCRRGSKKQTMSIVTRKILRAFVCAHMDHVSCVCGGGGARAVARESCAVWGLWASAGPLRSRGSTWDVAGGRSNISPSLTGGSARLSSFVGSAAPAPAPSSVMSLPRGGSQVSVMARGQTMAQPFTHTDTDTWRVSGAQGAGFTSLGLGSSARQWMTVDAAEGVPPGRGGLSLLKPRYGRGRRRCDLRCCDVRCGDVYLALACLFRRVLFFESCPTGCRYRVSFKTTRPSTGS